MEDDKEEFREELEAMIRSIPEEEDLVIGGDLNRHVGEEAEGYEECHGSWGYGIRNEEGERILEMTEELDVWLAKTGSQKSEEHRVTYKSGKDATQLDYLLVRRRDRATVMDTKVTPREATTYQHQLLVMDVRRKKKMHIRPKARATRIKTWLLDGKKKRSMPRKSYRKWRISK